MRIIPLPVLDYASHAVCFLIRLKEPDQKSFFKGILHPKKANSVIIYSPSSCCKPVWVSSAEHKDRYSEEWLELWHHC